MYRLADRICVASSFPEQGNRNLSIVNDLADGFSAVVGAENVWILSFLGISAQVAQIKPSLVVLVGSALPAQCDYHELSRACREAGTLFAFWSVEDPYEFDAIYKFVELADVIFSNDAWAVRFYNRDRVFHLPTAAPSASVRSLDDYSQRTLEVFFCGVGFGNRRALVTDALPTLERYRTLITGEKWSEHSGIISNRRLSQADLFEHYAASRCVLNVGRTFSYANKRRSLPPVTPGPRTFEAAVIGCVQLYFQPSSFVKDYFDLGTEIVVFDDVDELACKLEFLLHDPAAAEGIARAAQRRALADHTYDARALTILKGVGLRVADPVSALSAADGLIPTIERPAKPSEPKRDDLAIQRLATSSRLQSKFPGTASVPQVARPARGRTRSAS